MIKKILMVLGALFVVGLAVVGGLLFWAQREGSALQEQFFIAVGSGDTQQLDALMHPARRREIDPPVLVAWVREVHKHVGKFQGLSKSDFNTSVKHADGVKQYESRGTVNFEKGVVKSELVFHDGLLVKFELECEALPKQWFNGPADSTLYRDRAKEFLTHILNNEPDRAFSMMHENLQKAVPADKLRTMIQGITSKAGKLQTLTFKDEQLSTSNGQRLKVFYDVRCEKAETTAVVDFVFIGLRGHILAFDLTEGAK